MKSMLKKFQSEEGFDLVQVLVTVAILAVIATIAVLALIGQIGKGDDSALRSDVNQAITKVQIDLTDGVAPTTIVTNTNAAVPSVSTSYASPLFTLTRTKGSKTVTATVNATSGAVQRTSGW